MVAFVHPRGASAGALSAALHWPGADGLRAAELSFAALPCLPLQDYPAIKALRAKVEEFAMSFPTIGFEKSTMRYP